MNSMISIGKFIYFIGAEDSDAKIYRYDIQQRIIEKFDKGEFNFKRLKLTSSCLVHFNSKHLIYTFGGYDDRVYGFMSAYYNDLYELDVTDEFYYEFIQEYLNLELLKKQKLFDIQFKFR